MPRDYWDIDEIISEEEKMPCEISIPVFHGSHLLDGVAGVGVQQHHSADGMEDLRIPAKTNPLWLSVRVAHKNELYLDAPQMFCDNIIFSSSTDAIQVDLRKHSAFYFEVGTRAASLLRRTTGNSTSRALSWAELRRNLVRAAAKRWNETLTHLGKRGVSDHAKPLYVQKLTYAEEDMFFSIRDTERAILKEMKVDQEVEKPKKARRLDYAG
eukprot:CAMPEP_0178995930 /NCGR_PEP_ID=MMETSP0795-20121207/8087_1 /TAXON_ID=88552 /ORGANISM="Amoebophrya sp., Strain Ameob2" /LENGTH=211 /DNA_ID=CAMNT_0020688265 /DNA_START=46 /DNA_END=681 /DNA_ORIENTATION=+